MPSAVFAAPRVTFFSAEKHFSPLSEVRQLVYTKALYLLADFGIKTGVQDRKMGKFILFLQ